MGVFSWFGAANSDIKGSYCDAESRGIFSFLRGDQVDDSIGDAMDRKDRIRITDEDFDDSCLHRRTDENGNDVSQGPDWKWW